MVTCGGDVVSDGGAPVLTRGVCWSTSPSPTVEDPHTFNGDSLGSFTSNLIGLMANTTYYVRAYATNEEGIAYGSNITDTSATCGGVVTTDGGDTIIARGVCWGTSSNPTIAGNHTSDSTGLGPFTSSITGLNAGTTYYVRAYVTNSVGTIYGMTMSFTTAPLTPNNQPCPGAPLVFDFEGNSYNTIQIGNQCWMRENLRSTYYADGEPIPAGNSNTSNTNPYYYDSGGSMPLEERGYLYNWPAVMYGTSSTGTNPSVVQGIRRVALAKQCRVDTVDQLLRYCLRLLLWGQ